MSANLLGMHLLVGRLEGGHQELGLKAEPMQVVGKIVHAFEWLSQVVLNICFFDLVATCLFLKGAACNPC